MYTVKTATDFIDGIRAIDERLKHIRLNSVEIERENKTVRYNFICDQVVDADLKNRILGEAEKITAGVFDKVIVNVKKIVSTPELINDAVYRFLTSNFPSISIFLKQTDVSSTVIGDVVKYVLRLSGDGAEYVKRNGTLNKINDYLSKEFCSDFAGSVDIKQAEETVDLLSEEVFTSELQKIEHRTIKVSEITVIDDITLGDTARYIEDVTDGTAVVCGTITEISERTTQNGKPFFIVRIDDTTGIASGCYFTYKTTYPKIKELKSGDCIIARVTVGEYKGGKSMTFNKINKCVFPSDFKKKDKFKKSTPKEYKTVFPNKPQTVKIASVFDEEKKLPKELTDTEYVVFDLETTGLEVANNGITEIGAVKIVGGKVFEQFGTLINPDYPITEENAKITGITPEMVKDAPKISAVIPDFMKFISGAVLVAHNASFDMSFLRRFAAAEEYDVSNKYMDTMVLAQEQIKTLKHYDLHTLADYYGIVFHHHRAVNDAEATAEIFINLMASKYKDE